ncbi:MAG: 50S ribosomal protein L17 [Bacteroidetes bacterium]|nr:50S ribosomal protein L17 [Bacteroidota bacterium]
MRHGKKVAHLGRTNTHRKAMLANMASSLIEHKRINTTVARAKALKTFIEPLITRSKEDSTHNRRIAFRELRDKFAVAELFRTISEKVGDRPGGYTRIIKMGNRLGDNADMALIELVDFNEVYETAKPKKKSRRRGSKKATATEVTETATEAEETTEAVDASAEEAPKAEEAKETAVDTPETDATPDEKNEAE